MIHREIAVLDWRVHELADVVDDFVVVEATRTHSGLPRQLLHPDRDARFADVAGRFFGARTALAERPRLPVHAERALGKPGRAPGR